MKNPADWDEADLDQLITTNAEESINLEFKRADALENMNVAAAAESCKTEISKDISAFANSAGGMIIYGIAEDHRPTHRATKLSPVDPAICSKERLEQVFNSRIHPKIQGLLIHPIALSSQHPGNVSYIVQIPQSFTAHQAYDKKYYKRYNFQVLPMEDYEIRQTMNRARKPTYSVDLTPKEIGDEVHFYAHVQNVSEIVGHEISIVLLIPKDLSTHHSSIYGTEDIDRLTYVRELGATPLSPNVHPFAPADTSFRNQVKIPDPAPSRNFEAIIRVYDQFGWAIEAVFTISLFSSPRGQIIEKKVRGREEIL